MSKLRINKFCPAIFLISLFCLVSKVLAADYYIDSSLGNDAWSGSVANGDFLPVGCEDDGISSDCTNGPWQTANKVTVVSFSAGDNIYFKRGQTFTTNDEVMIRSSGTEENFITVGAYGTGDKPIINGNAGGWSGIIIGEYVLGSPVPQNYVRIENIEVTNCGGNGIEAVPGTHNCEIYNVYSHHNGTDGSGDGIYLYPDNGDAWVQAGYHLIENCHTEYNGGHGIKIGGKGTTVKNCISNNNNPGSINPTDGCGLQVSDKNWDETVIGGEFYNNAYSGIRFLSRGGSITGSLSHDNGESGILISGVNTQDITVDNITAYGNALRGIDIGTMASNITVEDSTIYSNTDYGIRLQGSASGITVRRNKIYSNGSIGFFATTQVGYGGPIVDVNLYYNTIYNNLSRGVDITNTSNALIYNNTFYGNSDSLVGEALNQATSLSSVAKNNISRDLWSNNTSGFVSDYNLFYGAEPVTKWGSDQMTLSQFQAQTGNELNGITAVPLFSDPSGNIFTLQSTSSAIDAGIDVSLNTDHAGNPIYGLPDIGAYEYQPSKVMGIHKPDVEADVRVYGNGKFRNTKIASGVTADFSVSPASNDTTEWLDVAITTWQNSGTREKTWTETSATITGNVSHTVGDLEADKKYYVTVDGATNNLSGCSLNNSRYICTSDGQGRISFVFTGSYSSHTFDVQEGDNIAPVAPGELAAN